MRIYGNACVSSVGDQHAFDAGYGRLPARSGLGQTVCGVWSVGVWGYICGCREDAQSCARACACMWVHVGTAVAAVAAGVPRGLYLCDLAIAQFHLVFSFQLWF